MILNGKIVKNYNNVSLKPGRLVVMLAGRFAGKKAILIKANEEATKVNYKNKIVKESKFPNGLVVGV